MRSRSSVRKLSYSATIVAEIAFPLPTLIASIDGMNLKFEPELSSPLGYPFAVGLVIL